MNRVDLRLYAILGREQARARTLPELVAAAVAGGATLVQYREKHADARAQLEDLAALKAILAGTGVPLLVNDRVDIARAAGVDGVHLGQGDLPWEAARAMLGPDAIVGLTVKTHDHARGLAGAAIDYACIGGVFATMSKDNPDPPVGLGGLARLAASCREAAPGLPVGAIAGIDAGNAAHVIGAGADGIAVISALFSAPEIAHAARVLRARVDEALAARGA